jgi:hypothetical protein
MDPWERDLRRIGVALLAFQCPPFKQWARVRAWELQRKGEFCAVVIWLRDRALDFAELERCEPEFAVLHADGTIERSPNAPKPKPGLRKAKPDQVARRTVPASAPKRRASSTR